MAGGSGVALLGGPWLGGRDGGASIAGHAFWSPMSLGFIFDSGEERDERPPADQRHDPGPRMVVSHAHLVHVSARGWSLLPDASPHGSAQRGWRRGSDRYRPAIARNR